MLYQWGGIKIESRKIIKFGNSSHVVSLPTAWLKRNNLNKGNLLFLTENSNNELILSPEVKKEEEEVKEIVITTENKMIEIICREIISAYINNFRTIKIIGSDLDKKNTKIKEFLHNLMALEIMEQTRTTIIAKDFLNMEKISIISLIKRMDLIARAMISDSKTIPDSKNVKLKNDLYENIMNRDQDVNRLMLLTQRACKYSINNPNIDSKEQTIDFFKYWTVSDNLEKIADESKRIARYLKKTNLTERQKKELINLYSDVENFYLKTTKAFYSNDKELSYQLESIKKDLIMKLDDYLEKNHTIGWVPNIIEKLRGMAYHIRVIMRVTYDY